MYFKTEKNSVQKAIKYYRRKFLNLRSDLFKSLPKRTFVLEKTSIQNG